MKWHTGYAASLRRRSEPKNKGVRLIASFSVPKDIGLDAFNYCLDYTNGNLTMNDLEAQIKKRRISNSNILAVYSNNGQVIRF